MSAFKLFDAPLSSLILGSKPLVLLCNDDGYFSPGLLRLRETLKTVTDVVVLAPATEQSAQSHSLSLHRPLRLHKMEEDLYSLDGTPADCMYVALNKVANVLPRLPDLVISGINRGLNLGQDVFYSGTVAAAREAAFRGIPAFASSADLHVNLEDAAKLTACLALAFLNAVKEGKEPSRLLNLNIPKEWNKQVKVTRLGKRHYEDDVTVRQDPRGKDYIWVGGHGVRHEPDPGSDTEAFDLGFATLSALRLDLNQELSHAGLLGLPSSAS